MSISIIRALVATTFVCSIAGVGCASQTASEEAVSGDSEGSIAQVAQQVHGPLLACENDVPATGYQEFPYNQLNWTGNSGWKAGCVGLRVHRNLPYPQNVAFREEAIGDFPQFEGYWSSSKDAQCRAAYITAVFAYKASPQDTYEHEFSVPTSPDSYNVHGVPELAYDAHSPTLVRIVSCRAQITHPTSGGCSYLPANYHRIDVKAYVNGSPDPSQVGPAKVYAQLSNTTSC